MATLHRVATLHRSVACARLLLAGTAMMAAVALAGCDTDGVTLGARALRPVPAALAAEMDKKNMPKESPILVRIFKEEAELEVWKQDAEGKYALLKTYAICRWSGELGPKVKEGDRQAPEGFYTITPGQMNPNSNYYLSFDLGFPNVYDKANDRTGAFLMVHGDCSSAGCYAMTDEQIQEIYALGRDSFIGGQKSFQVQAYPFRMTPLNLAKHRNNPNMPFWRMIKEGSDHFELTRTEPRVDYCEKRYVFDAVAPGNAPFHSREKCPVYEVPASIASAVRSKRDADDRAIAEYTNKGVATVAVRTGTDGGMHPGFLAKLRPGAASGEAASRDVNVSNIPLPPNVNPPRAPSGDTDPTGAFASNGSPSKLSSLTNWFSFGSDGSAPAQPVPAAVAAKPAAVAAKPAPAAPKVAAAKPPQVKRPADVADAGAAQPSAPPAGRTAAPAAAKNATPAAGNGAPGMMAGAAPVVSGGTFEGRWTGGQ